MPFNSTLDVLVNSADLVVLGPPNSLEIEVDRGARGDRGTKTFYGGIDPNSLTPTEFNTAYGYTPIYGDVFVSTAAGATYGQYYMYSYVPGGDEWVASFSLQSAASELFYTGNYTWSASAFPNIDIISASASSSSASLWNNITTGSINIGTGITTGTIRIGTGGTAATPITIGHTNSLIGIVGNTTVTGTFAATQLAGALLSSASPTMNGVVAAGTSAIPSRDDHVHPVDTSRAPLASPTFTGLLSSTGTEIVLLSGTAGSPSSNALLTVERGSSADVSLRWNETLDQWEYTNDGSTFQGIGSGGASGFETVMFFAGL